MIKDSITQLFDNYEANNITQVPRCQFKLKRNPFHYIIPETVYYTDLRISLKPHSTTLYHQNQSILETLKRYTNDFQFRNSAQSRAIRHTLEYTALYGLIIFGFYSRHCSGWKRFQHILKETATNALYSGSIFAMNQALYPFCYKFACEINQKPIFSAGNLLSSFFIWPVVALIEWNLLASVRKTLFICAFGQLRDLLTEYQRFYKLNPKHLSSRIKAEDDRLKHPSEDTRKKLHATKNSRASLQRKQQEKQQLKKQILARNNGQKIPSSHLYLIMPQIYRPPTSEQNYQHQKKVAQKSKKILQQKGVKWITVQMPEENSGQRRKQQNKGEKKSWLPW